jgi:hypothetical protein
MVSSSIPSPQWSRQSALLALAGLAASAVVHGLTFAGIDATGAFPALWSLHAGAIAAVGAAALSARRAGDSRSDSALERWPGWALALAAAAFAYAVLNFGLFFVHSEGGAPEVVNGAYVLADHGRVIRALTAAEFREQQTYITRGFSGHWMLFFLLPWLYFLYPPEPATVPAEETTTARAPTG